jgi:hypothetical protein
MAYDAPKGTITQQELGHIRGAYDTLARLGNATSHGGIWNDYLDRAHQDLGVILAWVAVGRIKTDGDTETKSDDRV